MNNRKNYITLLCVISAIAVVFLHTNGCFWLYSNERYWFTANIIESLFYFAVPIFFMVTGANLIDYQDKYSTKEYFKKRINKVLIPYVIWSFIGIAYLIIKKDLLIQDISFNYIFNALFNHPVITIYWFFISLICVYLCIPLFASIDKDKRNIIFKYIALAGFIINSLIPFVINVFKIDVKFGFSFVICSNYLFYVVVGYLLDKNILNKRQRLFIYFLGICGLLMHLIGTYNLSICAGKIINTYKGYENVPCILYSISIYVFIKEFSNRIGNFKFIDFLSKYTFPIYLMHYYFMDIIVHLFDVNIKSIFYRLGAPFIIVFLCIITTYIIRKIPFLRKIVP